ncbi:MAG: glycosyltransferase [Gemmatimonadetes bacterium]|nr:MAG: glycosyltransferase [Gemmatimonadota bacterium]
MPHISVIIPVYNRVDFLRQAVDSVLAQTYRDFELIVVDDGSTVDLNSIQADLNRQGHQYIRLDQNRGVSAARNVGVAHARGAWMAFLDSDDRWLPEKLARQMAFLADHPHFRICQTGEIWIRRGRRVNPKKYHVLASGADSFRQSVARCSVSPSSVLVDRVVWDECGGFDERLPVCEDYELWLRLTASYEVGLVAESLIVKYGGHADQLSRSLPAMDRFRLFALLNLLVEQALQPSQIDLVRLEIRRKARILEKGAIKRGNPLADLYRQLHQATFLPDVDLERYQLWRDQLLAGIRDSKVEISPSLRDAHDIEGD